MLVQLICVNGIVRAPLVSDAGDVTDSTPLPAPAARRAAPSRPTYTCVGGVHTVKPS